MRAAVLHPNSEIRVEDRSVPTPAPHEVLVEVAAVGVCGSDTHYYHHGRIGDHIVAAPMVLGHEAAGRIVAVGENVSDARVGKRVSLEPQDVCGECRHCRAGRPNLCPHVRFFATPPIDGAFSEFVTIRSELAFDVPESLSDDVAALLEPLSVGVAAVDKAHLERGDTVLVAGAGPVGLLTGFAARAAGASDVVLIDPVEARRERATAAGLSAVADVRAADAARSGGFDAFIDASGVQAAVIAGLHALGPAGRCVLVGLGAAEMALPVSLIQNREIVLTGVFRYAHTWPRAIALAGSEGLDLDSLVTGRFGLDEVESALLHGAHGGFKAVVDPRI